MCLESGASTLILSSSNPARISGAVDRLKSLYPNLSQHCEIRSHTCDVASTTLESNLTGLLSFATSNGAHKLDHVVCTAGSPAVIKPFSDTTASDFGAAALRATLVGTLTRLATSGEQPYLGPGPSSSITFTSGTVDIHPQAKWHVSSASNGAVGSLIKSLAQTVAPVRVNAIGPGAVETELWQRMGLSEEAFVALKAKFAARLPLGQLGRVEDIAELYRGAMGDGNLTGMTLRSEGGQGLVGFMT